ncbi:MAG: thioredoxin domain-containing protein [Terriglobia bacterium]
MRCLLLLAPVLLLSAQTPASAPVHKKGPPERKPSAMVQNYKETGSPSASIVIEEYADYECPHCAVTYRDLLPQIINEYVKTGKARLLHRDFPLPMHQFARQAAMLADAAGELGFYEVASAQIFKTQAEWSQNGNIEIQLAKVLPPGDMQKVREMVKSNPRLEESISKDVAMGQNVDRIEQTPTLVIVKNGVRQPIAPIPPFPVLKSFIDQTLAKK